MIMQLMSTNETTRYEICDCQMSRLFLYFSALFLRSMSSQAARKVLNGASSGKSS
jgi:hypothetical protein